MPSWFSKVFKNSAQAKPRQLSKSLDESLGRIDVSEDPEPDSGPATEARRRIVHAPVIEDTTDTGGWTADVRIKARVEKGNGVCVFMVDRPVLEGLSAWFPNRTTAGHSSLASALFAIEGVETVLLHGYAVTVARSPILHGDWKPMAQEIGRVIREHLIEGRPVVDEAYVAALPSAQEIRERLQRVLDMEINPAIASHSGAILLDRVEGNTVYIQMTGGCQGCAASDVTLRQGVHDSFRSAVPQIGAILDVTDHDAGKNPFYKELPAGMR